MTIANRERSKAWYIYVAGSFGNEVEHLVGAGRQLDSDEHDEMFQTRIWAWVFGNVSDSRHILVWAVPYPVDRDPPLQILKENLPPESIKYDFAARGVAG